MVASIDPAPMSPAMCCPRCGTPLPKSVPLGVFESPRQDGHAGTILAVVWGGLGALVGLGVAFLALQGAFTEPRKVTPEPGRTRLAQTEPMPPVRHKDQPIAQEPPRPERGAEDGRKKRASKLDGEPRNPVRVVVKKPEVKADAPRKTDKDPVTPQTMAEARGLAFSPDGKRALSGDKAGNVWLWEIATGKLLGAFGGHEGSVDNVAFSPKGRPVLSAGQKTIRLWDAETGKLLRTLTGHKDSILFAGFSPDGRLAVSTCRDQTMRLWEVETGKLVQTLPGDANCMPLSPDGTRALLMGRNGVLQLWDVQNHKLLRDFPDFVVRPEFVRFAFTPEGSQVVYCAPGETIWVVDLNKGKPIRQLDEAESAGGVGFAMSRDGRRIVAGRGLNNDGRTLWVWDVESGQLIRTIQAPELSDMSVAISADGRRLLSGGFGDKTVRLWNLENGGLVKTFSR
jgi:hypothetical protein